MRNVSRETRFIYVAALNAAPRQFTDELDLNQSHSPEKLAMALTGGVGELIETICNG